VSTSTEIAELASELYRLRAQRRDIADRERDVEKRLADLMDTDSVNLDDRVTLQRRRGSKRTKWQTDEIVAHLRTVSRFNTEDGSEVDPVTHLEQFARALKECAPLTPSLSWRAGALREWGIDPDEYASVEPGRVSVQVHVTEED
jgi:hypothetical protein